MSRVFFAGIVLLAVTATSVLAFDGTRKGFILGFGLGTAVDLVDQTTTFPATGGANSTYKSDNTEFGLGSDFRIGGGINDQFLLYYVNRVAWIDFENYAGQSSLYLNSYGGLGATWYVQPAAPSFFFSGLVGWTGMSAFDGDGESLVGFGAGAGVGYEFVPHWSVEASVHFGSPSDDVGSGEINQDAVAFLLTICSIAY